MPKAPRIADPHTRQIVIAIAMTMLLLVALLLAASISGTRQVEAAGLRLSVPARWSNESRPVESELFADYRVLAQPHGGIKSLAIARFASGHQPQSLKDAMNTAVGVFVSPALAASDQVIRVLPVKTGKLKGLTLVLPSPDYEAGQGLEVHQLAVLTDGRATWVLAQRQYISPDPWTGRPMMEQLDTGLFARALAGVRPVGD